MGKIKKSTKKVDIQALKKQRRFQKKVVKGKQVSEKSMANYREVESEEEEELHLEEKQPIRNTKIVSNEQDDEDDDDEMDGEGEDDDDEEEDEDEEVEVELDSKDKELANKKDKKEIGKDSDKTKSIKGQIEQHKKDLEELKKKDPKLFEFLDENDKELLNFNTEMDDDDDDDDDSEVDGEEVEDGKNKKEKKQKEVLTSALLDSWISEANKNTTIQNVKKLVVAFRCASQAGSDLKEDEKVPYRILNSAVFDRTLLICLENMPKFFDKLLEYDSVKQSDEENADPNNKTELPSSYKKWNSVKSSVSSYIRSIIHLLAHVSESKLLLVILKGLEKVICYSSCLIKYSKILLKHLLNIWSSSEESVRIIAFLCIRKQAILCPFPFIDGCLKGIYLNFVRNSKFVSATSLPLINFMCNCVIEIYGLDFASSYRSAFVYVRQLAVHLRNSLNTNTKESFQNIYNWQFINSVRAWVEVLSAYPGQEQISQLLYPITQIVVGMINLIPSSKFLPLRFHCIRFLNRLAETNGTFINCTPYLLDVLEYSEMKQKPGKSSSGGGGGGGKDSASNAKKNKLINFYTTLSVTGLQLNSKEFQDGLLAQFTELLVENLTCFNYHIGFPELTTPVILHLKKALKNKQYRPKVISDIQEILDAIEKTSKLVKQQRDQVSFSPKEKKQIQAFSDALKEKYKITPLKQLLLSYKKKSKQLQQTLIESTKTYNYEDDEEQDDDDDDEEDYEDDDEEQQEGDDDDDDVEGEGDEDLYHEDEEQEKQPIKKSKTTKQPKKPKFKVDRDGNDEDMVEDLVLSDDE
ncbi:hypothetical protein ACTA71_002053 [Dictyostelium dimigraforme]